jgi:hypothetical protein
LLEQLLPSSLMADNLVSLPFKRESPTPPAVTNGFKSSGVGSLLPVIAKMACAALLYRLSVTQCIRGICYNHKFCPSWAVVVMLSSNKFYNDKSNDVPYTCKQVGCSTKTLLHTYLPSKMEFAKCDQLVLIAA